MSFIQLLKDWIEVWALLIPLFVILLYKPKGKSIPYLVTYVVIGFLLNAAAMSMLEFYYLVPKSWYVKGILNNNILYNLHSIARVLFFSWYIITVRDYPFSKLLKLILLAYIVFVVLDFALKIESPLFLATNLFAAESIVLLLMCFAYFFQSIQDDSNVNWIRHPSFLVCAGISFYEVITFFIFLFFYPLSQKDQEFFVVTMSIYSYAFTLFCVLLAMGLYRSRNRASQAFQPGT
jgi:hypothetical protein